MTRRFPLATLLILLAAGAAAQGSRPAAIGSLGANNKEPIRIDADRLDVFDRENRAVFNGNVVAVQGETTMRCTVLTVFYEGRGQDKGADKGQKRGPTAPAADAQNNIKQIDCKGPVTVVSKDQVATGDNAVFDRAGNKVLITGNVALSQCQNVTRGERVVYDLTSGIANIEGGRVRAMFVPGGSNADGAPKQAGCPSAQATPAAATAPAAAPATAAAPKTAPRPKGN